MEIRHYDAYGISKMTRTLSDNQVCSITVAVQQYLQVEPFITNMKLRALTHLTYDQAISFFNSACKSGVLMRSGKGSGTRYTLPSSITATSPAREKAT